MFKKNRILSEAEFVEESEGKGIGLKSSLMEYAALKRKLPVTRYSKSMILVEPKKSKAFGFTQMNGPFSSKLGKSICDRKHIARSILKNKKFVVVESNIFKYKQYEKAKEYVKKIGFPVVVKPVFLSRGRGITTNITSFEMFKEAWDKGFEAYRRNKKSQSLIIERHVVGEDYRFFVVGDKVISASHRKRANVVGDGLSTVLELIQIKNLERRKNPYLKNYLIPKDIAELDRLNKTRLDLNYVPDNNELITLRSQSNLSAGGDSIDVTDIIHPNYHSIAVDVVKAIPGIEYAGVDFIIHDLSAKPNRDNHIVSEVEFSPAPFNHFPAHGMSYDYAGAILDFYLKK